MSEVKLMIYPEWMIEAMKDNGLSYEDGTNIKNLEGIVSVRDLIIYSSLNSLHMHEILETAFTGFTGVLPGLDISDIEDYFTTMGDDGMKELAYRDFANQVYDPQVLKTEAVSMLCHRDTDHIRLVPEVIIGNTVHVRAVPTTMSRREATLDTLESLLEIINDESPISMEDCALFGIYHQCRLQHAD